LNNISYELEGYQHQTEGLTVDSCETTTSSFGFDGSIVTQSKPGRAQVQIDGEKVGRAENRSILPIGRYVVSCHWCEYGSGSKEVEVGPGEDVLVSIDLDGKGFRFALGPYAGIDIAPGVTGNGARVGAMGEAWFNGRFGLQFSGDLGIDGQYSHFAVGPAVRALFPAPRLALPIALRADIVKQKGVDKPIVFPTLAIDLRICAGRNASFRIGAAAGIAAVGASNLAGSKFMGSLDLGVLFRGGPWKKKQQ
ncbi:MAG: PEGA domain-containing protein, partial [Proteobacteria bacterium]|nr:PEGA domain-containing protein [Pseudomonadota bacterium]